MEGDVYQDDDSQAHLEKTQEITLRINPGNDKEFECSRPKLEYLELNRELDDDIEKLFDRDFKMRANYRQNSLEIASNKNTNQYEFNFKEGAYLRYFIFDKSVQFVEYEDKAYILAKINASGNSNQG